MIKLVKWAYDLGVRHERVRIAAHLQHQLDMTNNSMDRDMDMRRLMPNDDTRKTKSAKEKVDFKLAVNSRVQTIINDMFNSNGDWIPGASLMFPDDKHTGEIK